MSIFHYRVKFPSKKTQTVTVSYKQLAYDDTKAPESYQFAYVVHPASLWKDFGPINLEVSVPKGVEPKASVALEKEKVEQALNNQAAQQAAQRPARQPAETATPVANDVYRTVLKEKTGELFIAVPVESWEKNTSVSTPVRIDNEKAPNQKNSNAQR